MAGSPNPDIFDEAACLSLHRHSGGVPRLINLLCDTAMVYGYAENRRSIDAATVNLVALDRSKGGLFRSATQIAPVPRSVSANL